MLFIGLLFIIVEIIREKHNGDKSKIIYRFVPKTFEEQQESQVPVSEIFKTMFSQPSPWVNSLASYDNRKDEDINKYFVTQG